jgi:hypothetical protein
MTDIPGGDPQLYYNDRRSHYTNIALGKANSTAHPDWDPDQGFTVNRPQIVDVYAYYASLALGKPNLFLWAGLGHMAGGAVVGGLDSDPGFIPQNIMVNIGRDIFHDLAWQHEAYLDAPSDTIVMLADLHDQFNTYPAYDPDGTHKFVAGTPKESYKAAWEKITSGDTATTASGNLDLLANEQWSIVQPQYDYLRTFWFSGLPRSFTNSIHPYHRAFIVKEPSGDILNAPDRWDWITHAQGMWDSWVACGDAERTRLLQLAFDQICGGDFGVPGRPDLLPSGGP